MMDAPYLMSKMACFGLHGYEGLSYDSTGVYDFIQQSAYPNSHFWMTEFGVWCSSCMSGQGGDESWAYARGTASVLINHLANGASAGVVWDGYDSQYLGYNATTGESEPATLWSYWGLFRVDDINAATKTYSARKQFYTVSQISRFVRPGAQRIKVSGSTAPLTLLAFYQSATGQLTLTGVNTNSSTAALSGTLSSLPTVGSLELYYTDSTSNLRDSGAVPVNSGSFAATVPANCVFTLVGYSSAASAPAITQQPRSQAVLAAFTALFGVTASGTSPLSYQWRFNGTNLANGSQVSGATSPTLSILNAQPTNAGSYSVVIANAAGSVTSTVAVLSVIVPGNCFPPPAGLVGWWPGDGNADDIAGTNTGALQGGATTDAIGVAGLAFSFDGTNAFVQMPDAPALKPANLTIEGWVLFSGLNSALSGTAPAGDQYIVFKQNSRTSYFEGYALEKYRLASGDVFMFTVGSASGQEVFLPSATLISTGIWYHVAAVRGSDFMQLYVNGQLETQTNVSFAQDYGTQPLYLGTSGDPGWDGKLKGRLDEVSLYHRALSASEVAALYAAGAAGKCRGLSITTQPQNQSVAVGSEATFMVAASGTSPLSYQWRFNGATIAGATNTSLRLANAQPSNAGSYSVVVTNAAGSVTSADALLTVTQPTPPRIDSIVFTSGGQSQLQISGAPGHYAIEAASNLVDWAELTNFPSTNTTWQYLDPETNLIQRFYRTRLIP
jgi:O-glycosyl hydrolase